jgi:hypothetical protein
MIEPYLAQDRRQFVDHGGQGHADPHTSDPPIAKSPHRRIDGIAFAENAPGCFDELTTRNRGVCLLSETFYQFQTKSSFQFTYLQADRRLRQVEPTRGRRKTAALDHFEKGPQLVQAEAPHSKIS